MKINTIIRTFLSPKKSFKLMMVTAVIAYFGVFSCYSPLKLGSKQTPIRGVIVTLIRSTDRSVLLTINMIHSVIQFHSTCGHIYPFLIFHDHNFTLSMRQQILSCTVKKYPQMNISFASVDFHTSVQPANGSATNKPMGYRLMCRFWTYDVFYHPAIVQGGYDYLMRMDDDSYLAGTTSGDLFRHMSDEKFDYTYRSTYFESLGPMESILERFLNDTSILFSCIYNNFFIIRLKWYYNSKPVQNLLHKLIQDDLILREYIGDGCVHAAMLEVDDQVRIEHVTSFAYGHNLHTIVAGEEEWIFNAVEIFYEEIKKACHQLTVLRGYRGTLKRIDIS